MSPSPQLIGEIVGVALAPEATPGEVLHGGDQFGSAHGGDCSGEELATSNNTSAWQGSSRGQ